MNQDPNNNISPAESDPLVSAEYRSIATERTPQELDASVLQKADAATRTGLRRFTASWFRPLAFVATLALSLALVLDLTGTRSLEPTGSSELEVGRRGAESLEPDPDAEAPSVNGDLLKSVDSPDGKNRSSAMPAPAKESAAGTATISRQEAESEPAQAKAPEAVESVSADFAEMLDASSKRMREQNLATESANQKFRQPGVAEESLVGQTAAFSASAILSDNTARPCDEQKTDDAEKWWNCIAELENAGRQDDAKAELELFNRAYPKFEAPQTLPSE